MTIARKYTLFGVGAFLVLVVLYRILSGSDAPETRRMAAPLVKLQQPYRETVVYKLQFTGDVVAIQQASIFSKVSGNLERIYADMGARVSRGQLLALIDTTELYQQYQQAMATAQNTRLTFRRTKELFEQNLVSKQDIDNADAATKIADAAYDAAKTRLGYAFITAPFPGYITRRYLDPGANVTPNNSTLFSLMNLDAMKIDISVLERDIPLITREVRAVVTVDAFPGKEFLGTVTRYAEAVDPATRTMAVEIDIPNKDRLLKPGMFANVTLVVQQHPNAITVPTAAILKDDRGSYVFTVSSDTARRLDIATGADQGANTEILTGLSGNEPIITTGQSFVKDGGPVLVQK